MTGHSPADAKGNGWWFSCKGKQQFYLLDLQAREALEVISRLQ